jgi:predicted MFS family arabinose efflux permease
MVPLEDLPPLAKGEVREQLDRKTQRLIAARGIRSVAQGALIVDFTLYLRALSWPAVEIGLLLAAGMIFSIGLTLLVGPLSDRFGRKRFLLLYEVAQLAAAVLACASMAPLWLGLAAIVGGYGRGANGATGPFSPIEQAWLAAGLRPAEIAHAFRLNVATGFFGMGAGSVLAMLPRLLHRSLPGALAYRSIFGLAGLAAALCFAILAALSDRRELPPPKPPPDAARRDERKQLFGLVGINLLNGFGMGMVGPFIAYWFQLRFGVGPARIGPVMAAGFLLAGMMTLGTGRMIVRLGLVDTVVAMRALGLLFLLLLPFSPSFAIAALLHILRSTLGRATAGARQALVVQLVAAERRGFAATLGTVSSQIPRAVGPWLGGYLFGMDFLAAPFLAAALCQGAYLILYRRLFRRLPFAGPG